MPAPMTWRGITTGSAAPRMGTLRAYGANHAVGVQSGAMGHVASWVLLTTLLGAQDIQGSRPPDLASAPVDTVAAPAALVAAPAAEVRASGAFKSARAAFAPPQTRPAPCDGCPPRRLGTA